MSLVNELIKGLLPENEQREVAVYGGGFKPPTKGHFDVIKKALDKNPNIDKFIVLIGGKERDGISPDESLLIWGIYKKYLPISVEIQLSSKPPIQAVYNYAKNNPEELVLFVIGAREGNEEDFKDIASRTTSLDKYPNMRLETVITKGGVSGTAARNAAKISLEKFKPFVPSELSDEEVEEVYDIVSNKVQEILTENASYSNEINIKNEIAKLTKHMIDKGMNIQPLPKLVFKNGDSENAKQFLGKTAYYDPNSQSIVLYTEGRHPKDIVRSFSHEMVHHTQFLEDRLGDVSTTNTMEDDNINKLEQEANLKGTMTFRNWTDSLNEGINEYNNSGPTTPKVYIVKDDGTYKESPIELLSKISNLTYDMGGGETNFYPSKNIVIVDNIPVEEFAKSPGEIKGEKIYVEYNLNNPTSLPKANKIIASQVVYHLDNREAFAQTVANSLKDGGTFEFNSDLMNQKDKMFLQHLSDEYGFGLPSNLNQYKSDSLPLKKGEFAEPVISYIYKITDKDGKTAKLSVTKKGKWWEYEKIDGDLDFKTGKFSTPPEDADPDFKAKKFTLRSFDKYLEYFGDSNTIVDFEKLNETSGADTAWTDDDNETITLQDILELTKNIKIVNLPTKELATIVLNWDDNPKEIERISQVEVSSQYPILIMVDDQNKIQWILDGNHRAQKALRAKSETIPAKLIKPSNLDSKARKILLNIVDEGKNKDPFGLNAYARELAMGLEENKVMDYKIYVDMDGVVADFDQRFKDLSGIGPREFEEKYGKDAFWDFIDEGENKLKFWVGIPQMSDAKQLIDFVSKYDYEMLTAPSIKKQSSMGKGLWMINQTKNGLFPSKPKVNYKSAKNKKDFAAPNHILIDDREDTINSWNAAGGIGILHTSASNTISQLKKLGL
jgi:hypothetical protein